MKAKQFQIFTSSIVFCASSASAVPIDTVANGQWNTDVPWGATPTAGSDYRVIGFNVNAPNATNNQTLTFAGDSLEVASSELQLKLEHADSRTANYNIPNLMLSGGSLVFDSSNGTSTWNLNTGIDFAASTTSTIVIRDGNFTTSAFLKGALTGSGDIVVQSNRSDTNDDRAYLYINTANNSFSGDWSAQGFDTGAWTNIRANAINALGSGTVTLLDRGALRVDVANGINTTTGITLGHSAARLYLNNRAWTNVAGILTVTNGIANTGTATVSIASMSQAAGTINLTVGGGTDGKLALSGNADFTGGSLAVTLASTPVGSYDLVTYGTLTGTPTVTGDFGRLTPSVSNGSGTADKVTLSFTGAVANLTWKGNVDSNWNNNSTANFDNGGSPDVFRLFDNVTFDESATSFTPTLVGALSAGTLAFSNTTDYTVGGTGSLAGATAITKSGSGNLTINTANTYTGNVTITGGTLVAGSTTALGASVVGGGTYVSGGGTLDVNGLDLGGELIVISGTGVGGNGVIVNSGASQTQALRFVSLSGDASIGGVNRWDIRANGTATLTLNNHKLTKIGDNYIALVAANVTSGDIDVNAGTLSFSTTTTVQGSGTVRANSGGTLEIGSGTAAANITRNIVLNGGTLTSVGSANGADSNISLSAASVINTASALTLNGNFSESGGAHALTKTGSSDLTVSGTGSTRTGDTIIDNGYVFVTSDNALGSGKITIGQTTLGATNHGLRLNGVTIDNDVDSQYVWTSDFKGSITATGGTTSTINGTVTFLPNLPGASNQGGQLASNSEAGSVLRLMGELNVGGGNTGVSHRDGVVEYGGGSSTSYSLTVTNTARLAATNGIGSGVRVNLGGSAAATLDLNGFSTTVESVTKGANAATVTNNGATDGILTVSPTTNRSYEGSITDGATNKLSLVKAGTFTYTLTGSKTYTGTTTVTGGTLAGTGNSASDLTVETTAAVAPGNGIGTFASKTATFENGASLIAELSSSATTADKLVASGDATIGTGVTLSVSDIAVAPAVLTLGTKLVLVDYTGFTLTGTFDGLAEGAEITVGLNKFLIAYNDSSKVTLTANGAAGGYDSWSAQITNGRTLRTEDADDDGFTNLQEFLFGTDPMASNGTLVTMTSSGGTMVLRWLQRESGATYTLQESNSLSGWATLVSPVPAIDGDQTGAPTDYDYYKITLTIGAGKNFFRIEGLEN